jgi:CheY-like chemotaxis protein
VTYIKSVGWLDRRPTPGPTGIRGPDDCLAGPTPTETAAAPAFAEAPDPCNARLIPVNGTAGTEESASFEARRSKFGVRESLDYKGSTFGIALLRVYLEAAGARVVSAGDREEGLDTIRRLSPAGVVLDILLPGVDGWDVLAQLKADPETAAIPVIVVSMLDERGRGFALGATEYPVKPVGRNSCWPPSTARPCRSRSTWWWRLTTIRWP